MADKEGLLPFKLIEDESGEALTSFSGLPLVVETCEALGLAGLVKRHVWIKQRNRGYSESKYVESVVALMAAGGDCLEDIERLRSDAGLKLLLGEMPPACAWQTGQRKRLGFFFMLFTTRSCWRESRNKEPL